MSDRVSRVHRTNVYLREGYSVGRIATVLGVSSGTVKKYVHEIEASQEHYDVIYDDAKAQLEKQMLKEEEEKIRLKNRSRGEAIFEEFLKSLVFALGILLLIWLFWWLIAAVVYVFTENDLLIWRVFYSIKGSTITVILLTIIITIFRSQNLEHK